MRGRGQLKTGGVQRGMKQEEISETNSGQNNQNTGRTFEQASARLDEIVRLLEKGDAPLDESLALFEEGAGLIKTCGKMLDNAEQVVIRLQKGDDDEPIESLFDDE